MRKILVIQNKRIGDVILTIPSIHALAAAHPDASISMVMDSACSGVDALLPGIEALFYQKGRWNWNFWRAIFFQRWDMCLEFTGTDRGVLVSAISKATIRAAYSRHADTLFRRIVFNSLVDSDVKKLHTVDYHLGLLEGLGIPVTGHRPLMALSNDAIQCAKLLLERRGINLSFAVIHPGAARSEKMWGVENWVRIAGFLISEKNLDVVLTGGTNPDEVEQIKQIKSQVASNRVISIAGETTLENLAATIAQSRMYVGVDTGAAHIADALGIPCVVLFGSTNPLHWGPRGTHGRAVGAQGFSSYPHNFPKSSMHSIPASHVEAAIDSAWESQLTQH